MNAEKTDEGVAPNDFRSGSTASEIVRICDALGQPTKALLNKGFSVFGTSREGNRDSTMSVIDHLVANTTGTREQVFQLLVHFVYWIASPNLGIDDTIRSLRDMLLEKNKRYGDSALNPVRIFSQANATEQLKVRLDDKLSRLARGSGKETEDVYLDICGYLVLLLIAMSPSTAIAKPTPPPTHVAEEKKRILPKPRDDFGSFSAYDDHLSKVAKAKDLTILAAMKLFDEVDVADEVPPARSHIKQLRASLKALQDLVGPLL